MPRIYTFFFSLLICLASFNTSSVLAEINESEIEAIAVDAYIYGYPLVTMDMTRKVMTNTTIPANNKAPMGQFFNARKYPDASFKDVTAPNADTLYSIAWIDLTKEPYLLHVPNENGRYYLMPLLSAWTEVFADPGTRTTGTEASTFAITGPNWKGSLPSGVKQLKSPTNIIWILGRTYCSGTAEDYKLVHAIQDQYTLTPLSYYNKVHLLPPPLGVVDATVDMTTPVRDQVNRLPAAEYFKRMASLMKNNPPAAADESIVAKMAKIGLIPGQEFHVNKLDPKIVAILPRIPALAQAKIMAHQKNAGKNTNGWLVSTKTGLYGTDYLQRALITAVGLGANLPQDAIYPMTHVDANNQPLNGKNNYVLHFAKNETPPVKGFWSLTMYNDQYFFYNNELNRYTLSPRDPLKYNEDGSLDLYISHAPPEKNKESNWLPAPAAGFILMLRFYWPQENILNGSWEPPAVKIVE